MTYVPKEEITVRPPGWNEEGTDTGSADENVCGRDISSMELANLAQEGHSFDFLSHHGEDIYSLDSGMS